MITAGQSVEGILHQIMGNQIYFHGWTECALSLDGIEIEGIGEGGDGDGYHPLGLAPCLQQAQEWGGGGDSERERHKEEYE